LLILAEVLGGLLAVGLVVVALRQIYGDLDRREGAEASLRRSERFLDSMVDLMPMMVFVKDARDLKYLRMNQASIKIMGRSREELIGKTDFDLFPEPIAQAHETLDREVLSGTSPQEVMEEVPLGPDGEIRTFYRRKIALRDEQTGEPAFVLGVSEDITDRKRVEAQILKSRQDAEDASRAKSDFLARMSHELRTPLNSIIGFSQLLDEQNFGPLNERQQRYVTHVLTSGRQLLELINDILDLSKVEAGRMELSLVETDVLLLMREALAFVEPLAAAKKMRLVLDVPEALPALLLDPGRFRQILYNLLGNALKFTPASGTITLRAALLGNSSVRITVSDTGIGIGAADLDRIFGEFEQVDSDLVRAHQGTGLGLPLARRLAELHRGRLTAESEIGRGSHFHLELPVLTPAPVAGAA
jgi:PAS domain S-box-containing protein